MNAEQASKRVMRKPTPAEIDGGVTLACCAATPALATAQQAADDAATQDFFEGRQPLRQPASAFEQSFHLTAL